MKFEGEAAVQNPGPELQAMLAQARDFIQRGAAVQAISLCKSALSRAPEWADAEELLGLAQARAGNATAALQSLAAATRHDPGKASAHFNYAVILFHCDQIDDAVQEVQTALLISPQHSGAIALQAKLTKKLHEREWRTDENFAVIGNMPDPRTQKTGTWNQVVCAACSHKNFMTAITCSRCGSLLEGLPEPGAVE